MLGHLATAGGSVDEDVEITEDETLLAQGDTWDIKKVEGTGA
jgi:hypothetical protein